MNDPHQSADSQQAPVNSARRKLGKAALAAPVVAASLAARPVLAAQACSISGFLSGNQSPGHGAYECQGYGCTPGFWKNSPAAWPTGYNPGTCGETKGKNCKSWDPDGTTLAEILPKTCSVSFPGITSTDSLMTILSKGVTNGNQYTNGYADVCHYIAAILNAAKSSNSYGNTVLNVQDGLCKAATDPNSSINDYTTRLLAGLNERGCFLDHHGDCTSYTNTQGVKTEFTKYNDQCTPICAKGWDPVAMRCNP